MTVAPQEADRAGLSPSVGAVSRVDRWWYSKVGPALAVSYCASLVYEVGAWPTARTVVTIAFVGLCAGSYGHLINDAFDIEVDSRAGKQNPMASFRPWQRFAFCSLAVLLGFLPGLLLHWSRISFLLLAVEYLVPTIYSVPPLRLKGRGALGLVCDCFGAHLVPCLFVISLMAHESSSPIGTQWMFVLVAALWALCLGLKGIVIHEFEDRENDIRSGISTFATETVFARVARVISAVYGAEVLSFLALVAVMARLAPLLLILLVLYGAMVVLRVRTYWNFYRRADDQETLIQWWQLSHPFYEAYFPLAVAIACAWRHPWLAVFPALQLVVFADSLKRHLPVLKDALALIVAGGRLDVSGGASARIRPVLLPRLAGRVVVEEAGSERWEVRVIRPGVSLRAGKVYRIKLRVRSDEPRTVMFGVWQDHAPWGGLGPCEVVAVSPRWQTIRREFRAGQTEPDGCLGVWLGGETTAVELGRWGIRRVFERKP